MHLDVICNFTSSVLLGNRGVGLLTSKSARRPWLGGSWIPAKAQPERRLSASGPGRRARAAGSAGGRAGGLRPTRPVQRVWPGSLSKAEDSGTPKGVRAQGNGGEEPGQWRLREESQWRGWRRSGWSSAEGQLASPAGEQALHAGRSSGNAGPCRPGQDNQGVHTPGESCCRSRLLRSE